MNKALALAADAARVAGHHDLTFCYFFFHFVYPINRSIKYLSAYDALQASGFRFSSETGIHIIHL